MLTGFSRSRWPRLRFSESYAVRISVKISRICEFRVIMGIMTGLLGCCSSSTLGSRANDNVKFLATLGFWLHHSPCCLGCWTNNTLAARSLSPELMFPVTSISCNWLSICILWYLIYAGACIMSKYYICTYVCIRRDITIYIYMNTFIYGNNKIHADRYFLYWHTNIT